MLKPAFEIRQRVIVRETVPEIGEHYAIKATVESMRWDGLWMYRIRWWVDGERRSDDVYEDELEPVEEKE